MKQTTKRAWIIALAAISALFFVFIYKTLDPATTFFPRCPFNLLTGLKCPGCGSQRAIHQLLNLNIAEAFRYNACLVIFIPIVIFLVLADVFRQRCPRLYLFSRNTYLSYALLVVILLWWLLRNIFNW